MKQDTPGRGAGSLAIVIQESLDIQMKGVNVQVFATDIDDKAIEKAREGVYPLSISADVSEQRLSRFFIREGDFYRARKDIRDMIVFSMQDVLRDPPFSRINLLCCRNLLIYLNSDVQQKLLALFHYTMKEGGALMLGTSETIGQFTNLYEPLNGKWKIYRKKEVPHRFRGRGYQGNGRSESG